MAGLTTTALIVGRNAKVLADTVNQDLQTRFLQWSRVATGFAELDASIARERLELVVRSGTTPAQLSALDPEAYRGCDLERRLLDAWYTGVLAPNMRHDETTLMWRAAGIGPPGQCHGGPSVPTGR